MFGERSGVAVVEPEVGSGGSESVVAAARVAVAGDTPASVPNAMHLATKNATRLTASRKTMAMPEFILRCPIIYQYILGHPVIYWYTVGIL